MIRNFLFLLVVAIVGVTISVAVNWPGVGVVITMFVCCWLQLRRS